MADLRTIYFSRMDSPVGKLLIAATDRGLCRLQFLEDGNALKMPKSEAWIESEEKMRPYREQIQAYFQGKLRHFTFALDLHGTDFQKKCWNALLEIPYGETCSYSDIALKVGSPKAFRAVGQANHNNPVALWFPATVSSLRTALWAAMAAACLQKKRFCNWRGRTPCLCFPDLNQRKVVRRSTN
jgi:O-6-methylguanine DNA methyltransferase